MMSDERTASGTPLRWVRVGTRSDLPEGRVKSVTCGRHTVCLTHFEGQFAALDNKCPHQAGPLGEGSIEGGYLRCPWHGWDFHPTTGKPPGGYDDGVATYPVETREDGLWVGFPEDPADVRTVSHVMAETMTAWGVKAVFGMVGHSNLGLADALRAEESRGRLRYVAIRHEGAAAFACSAYGKLTGRPAACLTIAGPGATNLLTGLWDAHVDRAPVVALTGQVDTQVVGPGAFQEVDLQAAFGKVATWSQPVLHESRHAELMTLACKHAIINRGVTHLIFPDEVQRLPAAPDAAPGRPDGRVGSRRIRPPVDALESAVTLLEQSQRPAIIVGHGARFDMPAITEIAERMGAPVLTTFKAKGLVSDEHPLAAGVLGRSGTPVASWFMNESDALLVLGASFSNHTGITPKKPTIQVDDDPLALGRFHAVDVPVQGEIAATVTELTERLADGTWVDRRAEVANRWAIWRAEKRRREDDNRGQGLGSAAIFAALTRHVPDNAIIAVDVGNNTYAFGRYFECRSQSVLMSGYLGSIGFALPAALGAWAATQEEGSPFFGRKVISISGDGGLAQYLAEVTTAVRHGMDITHVVLNNGQLGKISKEQRAAELPVWQTSLENPSFATFAQLCGAEGTRVETAADLDTVLPKALAHPGMSLVEVMSDAELV